MPAVRREKTKQSQSERLDIDDILTLSQSSDDTGYMHQQSRRFMANIRYQRYGFSC